MKKRILVLMSLVLSLGFVLAACGSTSTSSSNNSSSSNQSSKANGSGKSKFKLVSNGKFTFAASGEYKPFSYMKGTKMVGYDIAVGDAIAKELGLTPNPVKAKFSTIVAGVRSGRYDAGVASQTITAARLKQVNFSVPYYYSGPEIFTRPGSNIKTKADLKGKEIAVSRGSTYEKMASGLTNNVKQYDSDVVALQALAKGHHDAVITDAITGKKAISSGLKIVGQQTLGVSKQAVSVAKGNPALLKAVNKALKDLKSSGKLAKLSKQWVGTDITKAPSSN